MGSSVTYGVKKCTEFVWNARKMIKGEKMTVLEENIKVLDPEKNNSNS